MKRSIYQLSALLFGFAFVLVALSSVVSATQPTTTSPQIWDGRGKDSLDCKKTGGQRDSSTGWIHWVFSTRGDSTNPLLTLGGSGSGSYNEYQSPANVWHFYTPYFDVKTLSATLTFTGAAGPGGGLVISDYCPGEAEKEVYRFKFDKKWTGDIEGIDFTKVTVEFTADGGFSWKLGEAPVEVIPGKTTLTNVDEVINGLPAECDYTNNLPGKIEAPADTELYGEDRLFTLTVTNNVTCEKEEEKPPVVDNGNGSVLADVDEPQVLAQVVAPVGAVNAGAGSASVVASSLAGLVGSLSAVSYGAVRFFKGE